MAKKKKNQGNRKVSPPLKWHGGKTYLADLIISLMPPHTHYVEPYFGGGQVFLAKPYEGFSEVINDIDGELMTFWRVLQSETKFAEFQRYVSSVPFSEAEFRDAAKAADGRDDVQIAGQFFIRARQSRQGMLKDFTIHLLRTRKRTSVIAPTISLRTSMYLRTRKCRARISTHSLTSTEKSSRVQSAARRILAK